MDDKLLNAYDLVKAYKRDKGNLALHGTMI